MQLYLGHDSTLIRNGVTIFLDNQDERGFIYRSVPRSEGGQGDEHVKPFLAQIVLLVYRYERDLSWITENYYDRLKKYLKYWLQNLDSNHNHLSTWLSAPHTGMDNQHERAGYWYDNFCEGVDLNAYLVRECRAMSLIADLKEKPEDAAWFEHQARLVTQAVQTLWDDEDGFFYDRDERTGKALKIKYVGSFAAMWAGIATKEQAERLVREHILNPAEFWRQFPLPAYAATEPGYTAERMEQDVGCNWRAYTWIPTNYYVFEALRTYGYQKEAEQLAQITYEKVCKIGNREYYQTEKEEGAGLDPFWGWSLMAYFMPLELETGFDPTSLTPEIPGLRALPL